MLTGARQVQGRWVDYKNRNVIERRYCDIN
jgi:hypothetical protein